jgi:hypothetical protein
MALISVTTATAAQQFAHWVKSEIASAPSAYRTDLPDVTSASPDQQFATLMRRKMAAFGVANGASDNAADALMIPILQANTSAVNLTIDGHHFNISAAEARSVMVRELKRLMQDGSRKRRQQLTEKRSAQTPPAEDEQTSAPAYPTEMPTSTPTASPSYLPTSMPRPVVRPIIADGWGHYEATDKSFRILGLAKPELSVPERRRLGLDAPVVGDADANAIGLEVAFSDKDLAKLGLVPQSEGSSVGMDSKTLAALGLVQGRLSPTERFRLGLPVDESRTSRVATAARRAEDRAASLQLSPTDLRALLRPADVRTRVAKSPISILANPRDRRAEKAMSLRLASVLAGWPAPSAETTNRHASKSTVAASAQQVIHR